MLIHCRINFFLLLQTDTKNCLLYCTKSYIRYLLKYLAFLLNEMQFYQKRYHEESLRKYLEEGLLQIVEKISLWESLFVCYR